MTNAECRRNDEARMTNGSSECAVPSSFVIWVSFVIPSFVIPDFRVA
jgi:hypothetical protein